MSLAPWNFAILVDAIAHAAPDRTVVVHGDRRVSWHQLASRSRSLAWYLSTQAGLRSGDHITLVLPNCPEYVEGFLAARKVRAVPFGVRTNSSADALHAVIDSSDAKVVICARDTAPTVRTAIRRIPKRWRPVVVEIGAPYEGAIAAAHPPDDWELEIPTADDLIAIAALDASADREAPLVTLLSVGPLADGDAFGDLLGVLSGKGRVVFLDPPVFDAHLAWHTVLREGVVKLTIGGDAHARPLLAALPSAGGAGAVTTLEAITTTGAPLSPDAEAALAAALPGVRIVRLSEALDAPATPSAQMVSPSDVEHRLGKHASIADCVVLGISDPRIGRLVVAVVQVLENHYLDAPELAAWCRAHLSAALTPERFVFVDGIERTPSGEVDESALRSLVIDRLLDGA